MNTRKLKLTFENEADRKYKSNWGRLQPNKSEGGLIKARAKNLILRENGLKKIYILKTVFKKQYIFKNGKK
jgi:hypothetical protein